MRTEIFSIEELEKQLKELDSIEEKIELISFQIMQCKMAIQDIEAMANNFDPIDIKLIAKANNDDLMILDVLNNDKEFKSQATKDLYLKCAQRICERLKDFEKKAGLLLEHHQRMLDVKVKCCEITTNSNVNSRQSENRNRIIWKWGKERLLKLFGVLKESKIITDYSSEEILKHFCNERQIPFVKVNCNTEKIRWLKSDGSFSVFVDECANREAIEKNNKYRIFEKHFCNRDGKHFQYLAQKKNHTTNYTQTGKLIKKIFDAVVLQTILSVTQTISEIEVIFDLLKSIS
jgi:hypothetical protein